MVNSAQICIAAHLLLGLVQARLFYQDPVDRIVELNERVSFSCTLNCTCVERFGWYMAGHSNAIRNNGSITGLTIMGRQRTACTSGQRTYSIEVLATEALNKSAIYCVVVSKADCQHECSASRRCYSRPALILVRAAAADTTASYTISRTPEITPSPSSYSTQTLQGTTSAVVTLTTTVTSSPTNCSTPGITSTPTGKVSLTTVSAASTRVTCAQVIVLSGLVIASILL